MCPSQWSSDLRRGSAIFWLVEIAGLNPAGGMDVCVVLYSKDKRQRQDNQGKEVQIKYREKYPAVGMDVCLL